MLFKLFSMYLNTYRQCTYSNSWSYVHRHIITDVTAFSLTTSHKFSDKLVTKFVEVLHFPYLLSFAGFWTGTIYQHNGLPGFPSQQLRNGSVVVVNTHEYPKSLESDRAILLIRNPFEALLAEFNRQKSIDRSNQKISFAPTSMFNDSGKLF